MAAKSRAQFLAELGLNEDEMRSPDVVGSSERGFPREVSSSANDPALRPVVFNNAPTTGKQAPVSGLDSNFAVSSLLSRLENDSDDDMGMKFVGKAPAASRSSAPHPSSQSNFVPRDYVPGLAGLGSDVETKKSAGNEAFAREDFASAAEHYTAAIEALAQNSAGRTRAVLYSNRSAAVLKLSSFNGQAGPSAALSDALAAVRADPEWFKGYSRKGDAYLALDRIIEATEAYELALKLDPENEITQQALSECRSRVLSKGDVVRSWGSDALRGGGGGTSSGGNAAYRDADSLSELSASTRAKYGLGNRPAAQPGASMSSGSGTSLSTGATAVLNSPLGYKDASRSAAAAAALGDANLPVLSNDPVYATLDGINLGPSSILQAFGGNARDRDEFGIEETTKLLESKTDIKTLYYSDSAELPEAYRTARDSIPHWKESILQKYRSQKGGEGLAESL